MNTLTTSVINKLACPKCRGALRLERQADRLHCDRCHLAFRIDDNIPVLLIDESEPLK